MSTSISAVIQVESLYRRFPDGTEALKNVFLSIKSGEFLVIAGKNGSGKTVLMRHMNGLYRPTSGHIYLNGKSIFRDLKYTRQKIGIVFQNADSQIVGQTVWEDVTFGPRNLKLAEKEIYGRAEAALKTVGLSEKKNIRPHLLSGGEKRRLSIAGILAMDPDFIVMDEPFANLDYPGVVQVLQSLTALHQEGHGIICITHELEKILAHADRLVIMDDGRIKEDGPPGSVIQKAEKYGIRVPRRQDSGDILPVEDLTWLK